MYSDVLTCLTRDPLAGNVSPSLIGTQGTIPLSIVSTIPDIMQHYHDCSALACPKSSASSHAHADEPFPQSCSPRRRSSSSRVRPPFDPAFTKRLLLTQPFLARRLLAVRRARFGQLARLALTASRAHADRPTRSRRLQRAWSSSTSGSGSARASASSSRSCGTAVPSSSCGSAFFLLDAQM